MIRSAIFSAFSHTGYVRTNNEDEYLYYKSQDKDYTLLLIADGMGGHACGEIASKIAIEQSGRIISEKFNKNLSDREILKLLEFAIESANVQVELESRTADNKKGMGTTLTCALLVDKYLYFAHVGDTRIYLLDAQGMKKISRDDTYVQYLIDNEKIAKEEANAHPQKNVLIKALGVPDQLEPQLKKISLYKNTKLLLCTDGLYDVVYENEIYDIVWNARNPDLAVNQLIELTLRRGAPDNVSVIVGFIQ